LSPSWCVSLHPTSWLQCHLGNPRGPPLLACSSKMKVPRHSYRGLIPSQCESCFADSFGPYPCRLRRPVFCFLEKHRWVPNICEAFSLVFVTYIRRGCLSPTVIRFPAHQVVFIRSSTPTHDIFWPHFPSHVERSDDSSTPFLRNKSIGSFQTFPQFFSLLSTFLISRAALLQLPPAEYSPPSHQRNAVGRSTCDQTNESQHPP